MGRGVRGSRGFSRYPNYPAHKLEFLALKWADTDNFYDYLCGHKFTVFTDNNPLTYGLTTLNEPKSKGGVATDWRVRHKLLLYTVVSASGELKNTGML